MKRVAIVGSGISGLSAARALRDYADVTLLERSPFRGGHGYTARLQLEGRSVAVDVGVQIVRADMTANVFAMLESDPDFAHVRVSPLPVGLVSSLERAGHRTVYTNQRHRQSVAPFADDWARLGPECARFERLTAETTDALRMTRVLDFCERHGFGEEFQRAVLIPSMSIVNVTRNGLLDGLFVSALEYPAALIGLTEPQTWYRFDDSVDSFRAVLTRGLEDRFELGREVVALHGRPGGGVTLRVRSPDGREEARDFDLAIWTGDLAAARRALDHGANPSRARHLERLAPFEVEPALLYLHRDRDWLPEGVPVDEIAVFHDEDGDRRMHYNPNVGQSLGLSSPLWVSLLTEAPAREPRELVHEPIAWTHPRNSPRVYEAQRELHHIQGLDDIWFAGAATGVDGFDACWITGLAIARRIEPRVRYPFETPTTPQQEIAKESYDEIVDRWMFPKA